MFRVLILLLLMSGSSPASDLPELFRATGADSDGKLKAWIYFADRGLDREQLEAALAGLETEIDPHCIARRAKVMDPPCILELDLPLSETYVREVLALGAQQRQQSRWLNALSVSATLPQLEQIQQLSFVTQVTPVAGGRRYEPQPPTVPQDAPFQSESRLDYGPSAAQLEQLGVIEAHDQGLSGAGVRVMMLDTGYYKDHEAIPNDQILMEWDFINNDGETQNEAGDADTQHNHGTATLTTLGGSSEGNLYGPAYGATFLLAKTEDVTSETAIEEDNYVAALEWGEINGADVASASLGYNDWYEWSDMDGQTAITTIGVNTATSLGMIVTNSAGNENGNDWNHINAPADAFEVIACGAVNSEGEIAYFSSRGPTYDGRTKPEVVARGVSTWCAGTSSPTDYTELSGTSLSAPLIGGCVALLLEAFPNATAEQIRDALMLTADNADSPDNTYGWGLVNVPLALAALHSFDLLAVNLLDDDDGDGVLEPGEEGELELLLENSSDESFALVEGELSTTSPWITVTTATAAYPAFAPGEQHANLTPFRIAVDSEAPPLFSAELFLAINADGSEHEVSTLIDLGQLTEYYRVDVETGAGDWAHEGVDDWLDQWHISSEDSQSPVHSWKCGDSGVGDYTSHLDSRLLTGEITLLPYSTLVLQHRIEAEVSGSYPDSAYDGGVVEISSDGVDWELLPGSDYNKNFRWESGGGSPATHPFPGGTPCFSGTFDWQEALFDLSAWADATVRFRFRFGSDNGGGGEGWYIDDIVLTGYEPPQPGEPLVITATCSEGQVIVSWPEQSEAAGYRVYSCATPYGEYALLQELTTTSYVGPAEGNTFYRVTWVEE